jgi:adenylate kinase
MVQYRINTVFLGPPGVGKGTQAELLSKHYNLQHISTGELFRKEAASNTVLGAKIKNIMERGELVPDDIVFEIVKNNLLFGCHYNGFILDGFPRNVTQADMLEHFLESNREHLSAVINFTVPKELLIIRLSQRRFCPICGRNYNLETLPPKNDELCDICNVKLLKRADDNVDAINTRIETYYKNTEPLVEYYESKKLLYQVEATGSVEHVFILLKNLFDNGFHKDKK